MYLAMSSRHPLAQQGYLDTEALGTRCFSPGDAGQRAGRYRQYGPILPQNGLHAKRVEFMPNFATLVHAVKLGKGMSIFGNPSSSEWMEKSNTSGVFPPQPLYNRRVAHRPAEPGGEKFP
jgi:hypothetical protein